MKEAKILSPYRNILIGLLKYLLMNPLGEWSYNLVATPGTAVTLKKA